MPFGSINWSREEAPPARTLGVVSISDLASPIPTAVAEKKAADDDLAIQDAIEDAPVDLGAIAAAHERNQAAVRKAALDKQLAIAAELEAAVESVKSEFSHALPRLLEMMLAEEKMFVLFYRTAQEGTGFRCSQQQYLALCAPIAARAYTHNDWVIVLDMDVVDRKAYRLRLVSKAEIAKRQEEEKDKARKERARMRRARFWDFVTCATYEH